MPHYRREVLCMSGLFMLKLKLKSLAIILMLLIIKPKFSPTQAASGDKREISFTKLQISKLTETMKCIKVHEWI